MSPPKVRAEGGHPRLSVDPNPWEEQVDLTVAPPRGSYRTSALVELASGVDGLYLSAACVVPAVFQDRVGELQDYAREHGTRPEIELGEWTFEVPPYGLTRGYGLQIEHPRCAVGIATSGKRPALRFQTRAEFLHAVGPPALVDWCREVFEPVVGDLHLRVSRIDLFSDWSGWPLAPHDVERFVGYPSADNSHREAGELTGFEFGKRTSERAVARIYDKVLQAQRKGIGYLPLLWGRDVDPGEVVFRVEFEALRALLREFGLDSPEATLASVGDLWRYLTHDWLTLRIPTADKTRSRWPIDPDWEKIQRASMLQHVVGTERIRVAQREASLRALLPGTFGYLAAVGARSGCDDLDDVLAVLPGLSRDWEIISGVRFEDRIAKKRRPS